MCSYMTSKGQGNKEFSALNGLILELTLVTQRNINGNVKMSAFETSAGTAKYHIPAVCVT